MRVNYQQLMMFLTLFSRGLSKNNILHDRPIFCLYGFSSWNDSMRNVTKLRVSPDRSSDKDAQILTWFVPANRAGQIHLVYVCDESTNRHVCTIRVVLVKGIHPPLPISLRQAQ